MLRRWRLIIIALAGLVLAACANRVSAPPQIRLETGGSVVEGFPGGYCWESGAGPALCVDPILPEFEGEPALQAGESIRLQLDKPLPDDMTLTLRRDGFFGDNVVSESVPVEESVEWRPAVEPGEYILIVSGSWKQGDASYMFKVGLV